MDIEKLITKEDKIKQEVVIPEKKKQGRPKKTLKNNKKVATYVNDIELGDIQDKADLNFGGNISNYIKSLILKDLRED